MALSIPLDLEPMLAAPQPDLPDGPGWEYEPKWDGFRTLVFRDGDRVDLVSRGARPMARYFPELLGPLRRLEPRRFVLDGEVILVGPSGLDFDALQQRLHPAESRVRLLSEQTPVSYVAFDILALEEADLRPLPLLERRQVLEGVLQSAPAPILMTPRTSERQLAARWFELFEGAGLDGVIAKRADQSYQPGKRGWVKIKHERTVDCVVIGFRWSSDGGSLGSLLLGLYDESGELHYVGHTSSFNAAQKREILAKLEPFRGESGIEHGRAPGGLSRWSRGETGRWDQVRPELTCEVAYDKLQSGMRFRHATRFLRWRPDKPPLACRFDQIPEPTPLGVGEIFG